MYESVCRQAYRQSKNYNNSFHFDVTPWKTECLFKWRPNVPDLTKGTACSNDKCCCRGFHGQKINFEYSSDMERGVDCSMYK